jgi:hypothetical protein
MEQEPRHAATPAAAGLNQRPEHRGCQNVPDRALSAPMNATAPALRPLAGPLATLAGSGCEFAGGVCKLAGRSNGFAGSARELADSPHTLADRANQLADSSDVFADRGCQLAASPRTLADRDRELVGSSRIFAGSPREMVGSACHLAAPSRQPAECPRHLADLAGKPPKQVILFKNVEPYPGHSCPAVRPGSSRGAMNHRRQCNAALPKVEQVFNLFVFPYPGHSCPAARPGSSRGARWLLCWRGFRAPRLPRRQCNAALHSQSPRLIRSRLTPFDSKAPRFFEAAPQPYGCLKRVRLPPRLAPYELRCTQSVLPVANGLGSKSPLLKVSQSRGFAALSPSRGAAAFSQSPLLKVSKSSSLAATPRPRRFG